MHSVHRGVFQLRHGSHLCMRLVCCWLLLGGWGERVLGVLCWSLLCRVGGFVHRVSRWQVPNRCSVLGVHELRGRQVLYGSRRNGRVDVRGLCSGALLSGRSFRVHELLGGYLSSVHWLERLLGVRGRLLLRVDGLVVVRSVSVCCGAVLGRWSGRVHELWGRSVLGGSSGFVHVVSSRPVPRRDRSGRLCCMLGGPVQFRHRAFHCLRRSVLGGALLRCWRERLHSVRCWALPIDDGRFIVLNLCRWQVQLGNRPGGGVQ